jgi:cytochrome c
MQERTMRSITAPITGLFFVLLAQSSVARADDASSETLMRKSGCFKCHSVDKKKDGPAYKDVAAKYKDKSDAVQKLYTHLTTNPTIKIDGNEEKHETLKTKDDADIKGVISWVLSR